MKKVLRLLTIASATLVVSSAIAQIDGNTKIAPNFTGHDINGNPYDFYADYLDNDVPVVLDIMAHWCPPCWSYSQGGVLEDLYHQYGPNGTTSANEAMVFMADGDATSTFAELYNVGLTGSQSTMGDWVSITDYPIIGGDTGIGANDGRVLANDYELNYFPTIYMICPDRSVTEIGQVSSVAGIISQLNTCPLSSKATNDARMFYMSNVPSMCEGGDADFDYVVKNMGTTNLTAATIDVEYDGAFVETLNWTGNLSQYEMSTKSYSVTNVAAGSHTITFTVKDANATTDEEASNNVLSISFKVLQTEEADYTLRVRTDSYGSEASWVIRNGSGSIVSRKSDFQTGNYGNNKTYNHSITLAAADCYTVHGEDSFGDGGASFTMKDANNLTLTTIDGDSYEDEGTGTWESLYTVGINDIAIGSVNVYPNPISNVANIDVNLNSASIVKIEMTNVLGKVIYSSSKEMSGNNNVQINTENFDNGIYFVNVFVGNEKITQKLVK